MTHQQNNVSISKLLIRKGLICSVSVYLVGTLIITFAIRSKIITNFNDANKTVMYQTSMAVLPDLQEGNYYGVKQGVDRLVESKNFIAAAIVGMNGKFYVQSGNFNELAIANLHFNDSINELQIIETNYGRVAVHGIYDQSGILWGKLIGIIDNTRIATPVRNAALFFIFIMCLVVAVHGVMSSYLIKKAMQPLINLAGSADAIIDKIEKIKISDDNFGAKPEDINKFVELLANKGANTTEVEHLLNSFSKLLQKFGHFWKIYLDKAHLIAIGESTAMIAHDVRRPLAGMKGLLNILSRGNASGDEVKKLISSVDRSITQTNAMLNDVMVFSKGADVLKKEPLNVLAVINSGVADALRNHPGSNVNIEYDLNHLGTGLFVDGQKVARAITNIIDNALDAMAVEKDSKVAKGTIWIKTHKITTAPIQKNNIRITIADNGPGISKDVMPKIFDPFVTKGKKGGTGLGLAICKKVIDLHGGKIEARNRQGASKDGGQQNQQRGIEFVIELPGTIGDFKSYEDSQLIHHSQELEIFHQEEAQREVLGDTESTRAFMEINKERGRKSNMLILDDEPLFIETVRSMLGRLEQVRDHVKTVEAHSAEEALGLLDIEAFDYVIADIDLGHGRMNGYELTKIMLKKYPNTHVLIHSNKRREEIDQEIRRAANTSLFMGFLPKPITASQLLQFLACKTFEAPALTHPCEGKTVLLLNDDEGFNFAVKMQLKNAGYSVLDATNTDDALDQFNKHKNIHVILSDVNLGENVPDGYDFLKKIREQNKTIPFYFMSGYHKGHVWDQANALGATGYLQIPFEDSVLKEMLKGSPPVV